MNELAKQLNTSRETTSRLVDNYNKAVEKNKYEKWADLCVFAGFKKARDATLSGPHGEYTLTWWHWPDGRHENSLPWPEMTELFKWIWPKLPTDKRQVVLSIVCLELIDKPFEPLVQAIHKVVTNE